MILHLIEDLDLYEKFTSKMNEKQHYKDHVTTTHKEFFDHIFDIVPFTEHKDKIPPITQSDYVRFAEELQDATNAEGFVIENKYSKGPNYICYVKFRKLTKSNLWKLIKEMRYEYLAECDDNGENIAERDKFFTEALDKIKNDFYEVAMFNVLEKYPDELRTISYYITSNLEYLIRRKVDELPDKYGVDYFPLIGIKKWQYRYHINKYKKQQKV